MTKQHYELGPSAAPAWARCSAKPARERGFENKSSSFADWGTVAHDLSESTLNDFAFPLESYKGMLATVDDRGDVTFDERNGEIEVDDEMLQCVNTYVAYVRSIPGELLVEQRVPIGHVTGEPGGSGTADAIVLADTEMVVVDLKGGMGVKVDAFEDGDETIDLLTGEVTREVLPNYQAALYAEGALHEFGWMGNFTHVRIVIVQPRLNHISEHRITVEELRLHMDYLRERAEATRDPLAVATPGEKQCRFCRAKATCPELERHVMEQAISGFPDLSDPVTTTDVTEIDLSRAMLIAPLMEDWIKAVRAEVERRLFGGIPVDGFKLVQGRRGARQWVSEDDATRMLRTQFKLKVEDAFNMKLISPTQAQALLEKQHPRQWAKLADHIVQPEGKPSVARSTDKRPALAVLAASDPFDDLTAADGAPANVADLF